MIIALKNEFVSLSLADMELVGLLAASPMDPTKPAIIPATKNRSGLQVYPCVTFRFESEDPDGRFRETIPRMPGAPRTTTKVSSAYLDLEIWDNIPDSSRIAAIAGRYEALLDQVSFAIDGGRVFWSERILAQPDPFEDKDNVWFALERYRMMVQIPPR